MVLFGLAAQIIDSVLLKVGVYVIETGLYIVWKSASGLVYLVLPRTIENKKQEVITVSLEEYEKLKEIQNVNTTKEIQKDDWEEIIND